MRLPDYLIIGAMKSGTTSLFMDLGTHPRVFLPADKEPNILANDAVLTRDGRAAYARLFRKAGGDQICGEASTSYSKLPDFTGVPQRARQVLGRDLKIIYLVREPVSRTLSHHYHDLAGGTMEPDIDRAVRSRPCLINYSLYAMQILPWLEVFGEHQVRIVRFERYVGDRRGVVAELSEFLGIEPRADAIDAYRVFNPSSLARARRGPIWRFARGAFYRTWIRPWLSRRVRSELRSLTMPKAPPRPGPPRLDTIDYILDSVSDDAAKLQHLAKTDKPLWDLEAVRSRFSGGVEKGGSMLL